MAAKPKSLVGLRPKSVTAVRCNHMGDGKPDAIIAAKVLILVIDVAFSVNPRFAGRRGKDCLSGEDLVDED